MDYRQGNDPDDRMAQTLHFVSQIETLLKAPKKSILSLVKQALGPNQGPMGASGINHDGTPLQVVISLKENDFDIRVLVDPAVSAKNRYQQARVIMTEMFQEAGQGQALKMTDQLLARLGPDQCHRADTYAYGVMWLGAEVNGKGRSIYIDPSIRPADESWNLITTTFSDLIEQGAKCDHLIQMLSDIADPVSVGLESRHPFCRLKLHTRLKGIPKENALGSIVPMLSNPKVMQALNAMMDKGGLLSLHGFVLETSFNIQDGRLLDGKIDIAMPELCPPNEAFERGEKAAKKLDVFWPTDLLEALQDYSSLSYIGLGSSWNKKTRMNLYLKLKSA